MVNLLKETGYKDDPAEMAKSAELGKYILFAFALGVFITWSAMR